MTINQNLFSPQKFIVVSGRFPNVEFFAQRVKIPAVSSGNVRINTSAAVDFFQVGDKLEFEELPIDFLLDEDLTTYSEIYNWLIDCVKNPQPDFNPFSDLSVICLTNNQNKNKTYTFHNAFPYFISDIDMSATESEDNPIIMHVGFKYSHFSLDNIGTNL